MTDMLRATENSRRRRIGTTALVAQRATIVVSVAVLFACSGSTEPDTGEIQPPPDAVSGMFLLKQIAAQSLPADLGAIPNRDGTESQCRMLVPQGSLSLNAAAGQYAMGYKVYSSCDNSLIGSQGSSGTFTQADTVLVFRADIGGGEVRLFSGAVRENVIVVENAYFVFQR